MDETNFFHNFLLLYRPLNNVLNKKLEEYNLFTSQWSILFYINKYENITLVEIAKHLYVERPTITRAVLKLEELDYIEQIHGNNRREKRIQLTPLGQNVYNDIRNSLDTYQRHVLSGISDEEMKKMIQLMETIRNNIVEE
ncbi:MarR family transcriptional regulator [Rummeliibacillus sp. TYF005]|mgnify:FL=1|uniref:MarR family winged helix-turn-helix transcriptional regulator n=1 Tax=Rummeliibacillus sp. TYF005 TaxID=2058214 RepID=UPI000F527A18|nr:MarR family transcriptional regulator [Rummeliibacillus sp. TYF005]RPJ94437.1 MarR family transcriptional regulator [Rummeliibacillus sp. TYF005]